MKIFSALENSVFVASCRKNSLGHLVRSSLPFLYTFSGIHTKRFFKNSETSMNSFFFQRNSLFIGKVSSKYFVFGTHKNTKMCGQFRVSSLYTKELPFTILFFSPNFENNQDAHQALQSLFPIHHEEKNGRYFDEYALTEDQAMSNFNVGFLNSLNQANMRSAKEQSRMKQFYGGSIGPG